MAHILVVDDEQDICQLVQGFLEDEGYRVSTASSASDFYSALQQDLPDIILLDIWLEGSDEDGLDLLSYLAEQSHSIPTIMMSGHGTIETAVKALQLGAHDFIEKPFNGARLSVILERILEMTALKNENEALKRKLRDDTPIIAESKTMHRFMDALNKAAVLSVRVLLRGDLGTGKTVLARQIVKSSPRANAPLFVLDCAAHQEAEINLLLFGGKSASGGRRMGLFERANGGTAILENIDALPSSTQEQLLKMLQSDRIVRGTDGATVQVDVRVIATSVRPLSERVAVREFREDLYYRLAIVTLDIPPLTARGEDMEPLAKQMLARHQPVAHSSLESFAPETIDVFRSYRWPGNLRQLRNIIEGLHIMHGSSGEKEVTLAMLPPELTNCSGAFFTDGRVHDMLNMRIREARQIFEQTYLTAQVTRFNGNITRTANFIGMERSALHRKMRYLSETIEGRGAEDADAL